MMKAIEDVRAMPDEEFMSKYEDLVHHFIWKRYKGMLEIVKANTGLEMEDLVQYGMIGLIKARRDFNHELGYQFSTYAIPKIHGEVGKFIMNSHKIKVPRTLYQLRGKMMSQGLMEEDAETVCKQLDVALPEVKEALRYQPNTKSLQDVMYTSASGGSEEILLEDMLEDTQVIEETEQVENHMVLQSFYQTLQQPELIVWDMHSKHKTQQEIGSRVGRCQVQVSRILKRIQQRAAEFGKEQGLGK
ncbi:MULTISPECIES: sigma-70 family RNA polymerase sigma factor [Bacillus]|uniref:sigma-70 family RNA polymerase sigma factor n=1 Tax=Bacillus TaxID=1386 RepID=UPI0002D236E2|nr:MULTISPECIES: sigma-70 family RNA polymerase sigma factor [Bacillus]MEB9339023.1 sigma-70 family RNA polymerase sigma factor [Bacillus cereus]CCW04281.1 RNA polymerase sporulation specific sigma factor SigF [Bacillus sp. GeD10]